MNVPARAPLPAHAHRPRRRRLCASSIPLGYDTSPPFRDSHHIGQAAVSDVQVWMMLRRVV